MHGTGVPRIARGTDHHIVESITVDIRRRDRIARAIDTERFRIARDHKSVDDAVSLDQISGGEREQVYFAVRMALADVAFTNERQLVVLDDVFTYTDTPRLARIATILDEAADRFQIVLLTCHPERYRGLPNAKFFDLEAITASEG